MKKVLLFVLMAVMLTVPVYAKKLPVKIGDKKITYKNGKVVKFSYAKDDYYRISYKGNKVILKRNFQPLEEPQKIVYTYKKGKIVQEKYSLGGGMVATTKVKYKGKRICGTKTTISNCNGCVINGKIKTDKKGNMVKATFKSKDNSMSYGSIGYYCKNKYKKGRIVYQKVNVIDKMYERSSKYNLRKDKFKYKNFKMSKKKYRKAMAIVRYLNMPIYQGGI